MADRETFVSNSFQTELSFTLPDGATTVEVNATAGSPGLPFYLVIDADDDSLREVVLVDSSKDDDTFNLSSPGNRGLDGTVDVEHQAGALVGVYPVAAHWTDINDRVDGVQSDVNLHTHDGVSTAQVPLANISGHDAAAHDELRLVGEVVFHAGPNVPSGFLECNGQAVSRTTFDDLFDAIGTTWGPGNGTTTFNVPDLRDSVPLGRSASKAIGSAGGAATHSHGNPATDTDGGHTHTQTATDSGGSHTHSNPNTDATGGHVHAVPNTDARGGHNHSSAGGHSHSNAGGHNHSNPSTGSAGSHSHGMGGPTLTEFVSGTAKIVADAAHEHNISSGGGHNHSVSATGSVGAHNHGAVSNHNHGSDGNHAHVIGSTGSEGNHAHVIGDTGSEGNHAHVIGNTGSSSGHTHPNPDTDASTGHTHSQPGTEDGPSYPPYVSLLALIRF